MTGADGCRRVSVQKYSVQYKGYNLIGVTTVEASTTRGMTALVYCLINSSLYTGTVHRWKSAPNWLDGRQGCSQLSKVWYYLVNFFKVTNNLVAASLTLVI